MFFLRVFIISIFLITTSYSNENQLIKFVSLDFIIKNSIIGKKLSKENTEKRNSIIKKSKDQESKLEKQKNDILSKQNVLEKKEFEAKVVSHQKQVKEYQEKRNNEIKALNEKNIKLLKKLKAKIDKILVDYASENKIDMILKKEDIIVSNSNYDVTEDILAIIDKEIKKIE